MPQTLYVIIGVTGSGYDRFAAAELPDTVKNFSLMDSVLELRKQKHPNNRFMIDASALTAKKVNEVLNNGKDVSYANHTVSHRRYRKDLLYFFYGFQKYVRPLRKVCVWVDTPLEKCLENNKAQGMPDRPDWIERNYKEFVPPSHDEGWDEIWYAVPREDGSFCIKKSIVVKEGN